MESSSKKDKQQKEKQSKDKSYLTWDLPMDKILIEVLLEEYALGQKTDNGWNMKAINNVCFVLRNKLGKEVNAQNVRYRLKTLRKRYLNAKEVISQSDFGWDKDSQSVTADDEAWKEYIEKHPKNAEYRHKRIPFYDDLAIIVGNDQATGERCTTRIETELNMSPIEEIDLDEIDDEVQEAIGQGDVPIQQTGSSSVFSRENSSSKRKRKRNSEESSDATISILASAAMRMATAMERPNIAKLQKELNEVPDISREIMLEAIDYLGERQEAAQIFLGLASDMKRDWLFRRLGKSDGV